MFLPFIIALLLGIASPSDNNSHRTNSNTTTTTSGEETPGDDTGGEVGHTPIRN